MVYQTKEIFGRELTPLNGVQDPNLAGILIPRQEIAEQVGLMAEALAQQYERRPFVAVCMLNGAKPFYEALLGQPVLQGHDITWAYLKASSYNGDKSTGRVKLGPLRSSLEENSPIVSVEGRSVVVIDDIADTRKTLKTVAEVMKRQGASDVSLVALLDKPERKVERINIDYVGFRIDDKFVVGCGLDFNDQYRELLDICVVET